MKHKWITALVSLSLVAGLFGVLPAPKALAASGTLDFGNTTDGTTATTSNTGFGGVRIGSGSGSFIIKNPGQEIGTLAELEGVAPTGTSINSVGVTSTEYGTAANTFTISFEVYFSGGSSGIWYFFAGNGASFGSTQTVGFTGNQVFTGLKFTYGASSAITTDNRNGSAWNATGISGTPFAQNTPYTVTIIGNNSASAVSYGASQSVAVDKYDLWVNGTLVGNDLAKAQLSNNTAINAFRFYGESSTGNVAKINLDNIRWWNQIVPPSVSSYSTVSSFPAQAYSVVNMNSGDASLAGDASVNELLIFNNGNLAVGGSNFVVETNVTVSGTPGITSMVVTDTDGSASGDGFLCKRYDGAGSFTFPVGDTSGTTEYSPATINFSAGSFNSGNNSICTRVTDAIHPNWPGVTYPSYITRYWTVNNTNITGFTANAGFTYVDDDVVIGGSQTEASLAHKIWDGSAWTTGNAVNTSANTFATDVTTFSDHTAFSQNPLAVTLSSFDAVQQGNAVQVTWETATEQSNRGFNLYRSTTPDAPAQPLNSTLIPSQAQGSMNGFVYTWTDSDGLVDGQTVYYWVEDVDMNGAATLHGPVSVTYVAPTAVTLSQLRARAGSGNVALWVLPAALLAVGGLAVWRRRSASLR